MKILHKFVRALLFSFFFITPFPALVYKVAEMEEHHGSVQDIQSKWAHMLYCILKIMSLPGAKGSMLTAHYKRFKFPKYGVPVR